MSKEIERKFLISEFPEHLEIIEKNEMEQGYLFSDDTEIRIRRKDKPISPYSTSKFRRSLFFMTIKGNGSLVREEIEFPIECIAYSKIKELINKSFIQKYFREYNLDNYKLQCSHVDKDTENEFYYAEIEFESEEEANNFDMSKYPFLLEDVTYDENYKMKNYWKRTRG